MNRSSSWPGPLLPSSRPWPTATHLHRRYPLSLSLEAILPHKTHPSAYNLSQPSTAAAGIAPAHYTNCPAGIAPAPCPQPPHFPEGATQILHSRQLIRAIRHRSHRCSEAAALHQICWRSSSSLAQLRPPCWPVSSLLVVGSAPPCCCWLFTQPPGATRGKAMQRPTRSRSSTMRSSSRLSHSMKPSLPPSSPSNAAQDGKPPPPPPRRLSG